MQRVSGANYAANAFGAGKNGYQDYNPSNGQAGTTPNASALNALQEEVASFIEGRGIALNANDNTQLAQAIANYVSAALAPYELAANEASDLANAIAGLESPAEVAAAITAALANYAPLNSPAFTGTPTGPTPGDGDNSTRLATTAYVERAGVGSTVQAWADVTGSRGSGTTYYNTTTRPIMVTVSLPDTNDLTAYVSVTVAGVVLINADEYDHNDSTASFFTSFIVPPGNSYVVTVTGGTIGTWCELR